MRRTIIAVLTLVLVAMPAAPQDTRVVDFADAVESALPAVVTVAVVSADGPGEIFGFTAAADADRRAAVESAYRRSPDLSGHSGSGSGFVVRRGGQLYVVTNAHVIQSAGTRGEIATFSVNQTEYGMRLVGADTYRDVAVLGFIDAPGSELGVLEIHRGDDLRVGSPVFAIGNPLGIFPYSVSSGVIGGLNRSLTGFTGRDGYLQTDAAIIWGNSGGPLIDGRSRVVGLNTRIHLVNREPYAFAVPQLNFALEGQHLARIVDDIIRDGRFQRAYLGGLFQQTGRQRGVRASVALGGVVDGSPAAQRLGSHVGSRLVAINGERITDVADVNGLFERVRPGETVRLTFARGDQQSDVSVRTGRLGDDEGAALGRHLAQEYLGMSVVESGQGLRVLTGPGSRPSHVSLHGTSQPPRSGDVVAVTGYYHANSSTFWRTGTLREFAMASRIVMPTGWLGVWLIRDGDVYVADADIAPTAAI